jgi:hypothetical protein
VATETEAQSALEIVRAAGVDGAEVVPAPELSPGGFSRISLPEPPAGGAELERAARARAEEAARGRRIAELVEGARAVVAVAAAAALPGWRHVQRSADQAAAVVEVSRRYPEGSGLFFGILGTIAMRAREEAAIAEAAGEVAPWRGVVWRALLSAASIADGDEAAPFAFLPCLDGAERRGVPATLIREAFATLKDEAIEREEREGVSHAAP